MGNMTAVRLGVASLGAALLLATACSKQTEEPESAPVAQSQAMIGELEPGDTSIMDAMINEEPVTADKLAADESEGVDAVDSDDETSDG